MLGSYGKKKNEQELEKFQNSSSDKINFMIVLDKMNEGKHGKYNKLIWFRTLDDNSFVLCSQQLGRISKIRKRGLELSENERPLAIDLTNNLLRIQGTKELKKSIESDDISKFRLVVDWIKEYYKIPDINSKDQIESSMAGTLKVIIYKYHNKVNNIESINGMKKKMQVKEIKRLSEELEFDIWDLRLPKRTKEARKRREVPYYLKANALYRDYMKVIDEFQKKRLTWDEWYKLLKQYYEEHGNLLIPFTYLTSDGICLGQKISELRKLYKDGKLKKELIEQLNAIEMVWVAVCTLTLKEKIKIFIEMLNKNNIKILNSRNEEKFEGTDIEINYFWHTDSNRDKIIKILFEEYKNNNKYDKAREIVLNYLKVSTIDEYYGLKNKKKKKNNIKNKEKIIIFIEMLNKENERILVSSSNEKFERTDIEIKNFWHTDTNRKKVKKLLFEEYKDNPKYDKARQLIKKWKFDNNVDNIKTKTFIEMLKSGNTEILRKSNTMFFKGDNVPADNINIGCYWTNEREKILLILFEEYKDKPDYDSVRKYLLSKLGFSSINEYYNSLEEKKIIKFAKVSVIALQTALSKGYLLEKEVLEYPTYKKYINIKKK